MEEQPNAGTLEVTPPKRRRRFLKRTAIRVPDRMPIGVRELWKASSEEERAKAHKAAVLLLQAWLGKISREDAAKELDLLPLRFWQLSQQAVAGMVAGCLKQPRSSRGRPRADGSTLPPEEDPVALRKRIATLEQEILGARRLIDVLKQLPLHRESAASPGTGHGRARRIPKETDPSGDERGDRRAGALRRARRSRRAGESPGALRTDAASLEGPGETRRGGGPLGPPSSLDGAQRTRGGPREERA